MLMPSRSSSSHPESSHPYRDTRSQSTTSLETISKRSWVSRWIPKIQREGLLPLPEGARLSSNPPELPAMPHMSLELPHLARTPNSPPMSGDSTWGETLDPSPLPPITILGPTGTPLHHPQPVSPPQIFGTTSTFPTVPISLPLEQTHPITEPHPQQDTPGHGTRPQSSRHSSLYESRHPSPVLPPTSTPHREAVGKTSGHPSDLRTVPLELLAGSSSQIESSQSSSTKNQSQQGTRSEIGQQSRPATPAQPLTHHNLLPPSPHRPSIMPLDRPLSRRNSQPPTPTAMTLSSAISFYEQTINDPSIVIPTILQQASYEELYVYFAYELPFDSTWGETQAGNDYLMRKIRGLHADDILQYEAERNTRFLWNSLHRQNVMEEFPPYEEEA